LKRIQEFTLKKRRKTQKERHYIQKLKNVVWNIIFYRNQQELGEENGQLIKETDQTPTQHDTIHRS
jgi:hypothetical protein